jgi:N-acetylglucosamine-6-phosphate deacetylase
MVNTNKRLLSKARVADMSLPPEQRGRKNKKNRGKTKGVIAQLGHANGKHEFNDQRRKWEKKNKRR